MTEFLAAMTGALVGALMVFVAELWRQILAGKAAARLIRVELHSNSLICEQMAKGYAHRYLSDAIWQAHSVEVVPLLTSEAVETTATAYLGLPLTNHLIDELVELGQEAAVGADIATDLESHSMDFRKAAYWMYAVESKGRFRTLIELLRNRIVQHPGEMVEKGVKVIDSQTD